MMLVGGQVDLGCIPKPVAFTKGWMTSHGKRPLNVSVLFRGYGFEICEWLFAESIPHSEHIPDQGRNPRAPIAGTETC